MTVTPYTEPQIDPTVTIPWPEKVNQKIAEQQEQIDELRRLVEQLITVHQPLIHLHQSLSRRP